MSKKKTPLERLSSMPAFELIDWFGEKVFSRGRDYQRSGAVTDLVTDGNDRLLAWVMGTERYATMIVMGDEDGEVDCFCTCPYELECKHGVAVILDYQKKVRSKTLVPAVKENDPRYDLLNAEPFDEDADDEWDCEEDYEEDWKEDWEEEEDWDDDLGPSSHVSYPTPHPRIVQEQLDKLKKKDLIKLILLITKQYPQLGNDILFHSGSDNSVVDAIVDMLQRDILKTSGQHGYHNYWSGKGFTPDYSKIRFRLELLLQKGYPDEVLELGEELIRAGNEQIEESDDEGNTEEEIARCIPIIVEALKQSSQTPTEKILWGIDAILQDKFNICMNIKEYIRSVQSEKVWAETSDRLMEQLYGSGDVREPATIESKWRRNVQYDWIIYALEQAGRSSKIISLCEREAEITNRYDRVVDRLIEANRLDEAEKWIWRGLKAAGNTDYSVRQCLEDAWLKIHELREDWPAVTAYSVEKFLLYPLAYGFDVCIRNAEKAGVGDIVRKRLLTWLEKGSRPEQQPDWPLPATGLHEDKRALNKARFPQYSVLLDIALAENDSANVLSWFQKAVKKGHGVSHRKADEVAGVIREDEPDLAVNIWKQLAENQINQVKPKAYMVAAKYLSKAGKVQSDQNQRHQFVTYLKQLRQEHKRKYRLIEVLEGLENI